MLDGEIDRLPEICHPKPHSNDSQFQHPFQKPRKEWEDEQKVAKNSDRALSKPPHAYASLAL